MQNQDIVALPLPLIYLSVKFQVIICTRIRMAFERNFQHVYASATDFRSNAIL